MAIKLQTIGIVAEDMRKTLDFYRTLGFPIREELNEEDNVDFETDGIIMGFISGL